jgi:hypothetical protein
MLTVLRDNYFMAQAILTCHKSSYHNLIPTIGSPCCSVDASLLNPPIWAHCEGGKRQLVLHKDLYTFSIFPFTFTFKSYLRSYFLQTFSHRPYLFPIIYIITTIHT